MWNVFETIAAWVRELYCKWFFDSCWVSSSHAVWPTTVCRRSSSLITTGKWTATTSGTARNSARLLKRTCSHVTSASSALEVLNVYALYKSTHLLTCLLVTCQSSKNYRNVDFFCDFVSASQGSLTTCFRIQVGWEIFHGLVVSLIFFPAAK